MNREHLTPDDRSVFREQALTYNEGLKRHTCTLIAPPWWLRYSHVLVLISLLISLWLLGWTRYDEHAEGPSAIRSRRSAAITANVSGSILSTPFPIGHAVSVDDAILTYVETATGRERTVAAPLAGTLVSTLSAGRSFESGTRLAAVVDTTAGLSVTTALPHIYLTRVHSGMTMTLMTDAVEPHRLQIDTVMTSDSDSAGFPELSPHAGLTCVPSQTLVLVSATMPYPPALLQLNLEGYRDVRMGRADITLNSRYSILALVPALNRLFDSRSPGGWQ